MPKFLEKKLKERYGKDSAIPYKIMNARGFMRGNKETAKGKRAEKKHHSDYEPSAALKGLGGEGHHKGRHKGKHKGPSFTEAMNRS